MHRLYFALVWVILRMPVGATVGIAEEPPETSPAPVRIRIEKTKESAWPADVGVIEVWPSGVNPLHYSAAVFTGDGQRTSSQTLWDETHGSLSILFKVVGTETSYDVLLADHELPAGPPWKPEAGVVVETRPCPKLPANNWEQARRVLAAATVLSGRSLVPNIFLGTNPHGPSTFYTASFHGYFTATKGGDYGFATVSDGPSFLWIDSRIVAQWPGVHDPGGGRQGEHNGTVRLEPGRHQIEYTQIHFEGGAAAVAAWKPPGQARFEVMPPRAFAPVATFAATGAAVAAEAKATYFEWRNTAHNVLTEATVIDVAFKILSPQRGWNYRWTFDDGGEAEGPNPRHCFVRPGVRQATLTSLIGRQVAFTNVVAIKVEPNWMQQETWRQDLFERQRRELMTRDLSRSPRDDLVELVQFANDANDLELLERAGEACVAQRSAFTSAQALIFYTIGFRLQHRPQNQSGPTLAEVALRTAVSLSASNPPLNEKTKLRLAEFLILGCGQREEGSELLRTIGARLAPEEKRLVELLKGDVLLASGNVAEARKSYLAVKEPGLDAKQELRSRARLHSAVELIGRGELNAGEEVLDSILVESPLERMSPETNLPLIQLYLDRKEYGRVTASCHRLMPVAEQDYGHAPQILFALATADLGLSNSSEGEEILRKLLKTYPESEAAARAKATWGREIRGAKSENRSKDE